MKKSILLTGITLVAALFLAASSAIAEDKPGAPNDWNRRHWKAKADTNKDGALDKTERDAAKAVYAEKREEWKENRQEHKEKMKEKADTNHDGALDQAEKDAAKAHFQEKRAEWKEKADKNQDGHVDRVEKHRAMEHMQKHKGPRS